MIKKLLLTAILFLTCSSVQAATTWYVCSGGSNINGTGFTSLAADQVGCTALTGTPTTGDSIVLNANSGPLTYNTAPPSLVTFTETSYASSAYSPSVNWATYTQTLTGLATFDASPMTSTSATVNLGAGITLTGTPTGTTFPLLTTGGAGTFTSGGFTWPGAMTFANTGTVTFTGNWTNNGLTTTTAALNGAGTGTLTLAGGFTQGANIASVAGVLITGGIWTTTGAANYQIASPLTLGATTITGIVSVNGNVTLSANVQGTGILALTTTNPTFTSNGYTIPNLAQTVASGTLQFTGNLLNTGTYIFTGTWQGSATPPILGGVQNAYNIVCANLVLMASQGQKIYFRSTQSVTVTNSMYIVGNYQVYTPSLVVYATTGSSAFNLNYTGSIQNETILNTSWTDVKADGSGLPAWAGSHAYLVGDCVTQGGLFYRCLVAHTSGTFATDLANGDWVKMVLQPIYNKYLGTAPTLLRTTGIYNVPNNTNGFFIQ